jgi:phospholipase/lecithinase/hemolysin
MNRHVRIWLAAALAVAAMLVAGNARALAYTHLIAFGDSLSDSGNNATALDAAFPPPGTARTATPIVAPNFIPEFPYASDRYSNGPVWVEYLAAHLGLSAQPSLLGGTNFAFGGARSGPFDPTFTAFPPSLSTQVGAFLGVTGGVAPPSALYVVQGGGNDARDALVLLLGGGDPSALIDGYATDMASIVEDLQDAGARDILLANVPNIGVTPAVRLLAEALGLPLEALAADLVMMMNSALEAELADLPGVPGVNIQLLNLFELVNQVVANPADFGFTDTTSSCAFLPACIADPATTFFWDGIHPTTAAHALLAQQALLVLLSEPGSLALIAIAILAGSGLRLRRRKTR